MLMPPLFCFCNTDAYKQRVFAPWPISFPNTHAVEEQLSPEQKSTSLVGSLFYGAPKGDQSLFLGFFAQMAEISGPKPALSAIHSFCFLPRDQTCSHFQVVPPLAPYHTRRPLMAVCLGKLDACNPIEIRRLDLCNGRMGTLIVKKIVFCFFFPNDAFWALYDSVINATGMCPDSSIFQRFSRLKALDKDLDIDLISRNDRALFFLPSFHQSHRADVPGERRQKSPTAVSIVVTRQVHTNTA